MAEDTATVLMQACKDLSLLVVDLRQLEADKLPRRAAERLHLGLLILDDAAGLIEEARHYERKGE